MTTYLTVLLAIALLCGAWGVFQLWLAKHDPELAEQGNSCGNCSCQPGDCENK